MRYTVERFDMLLSRNIIAAYKSRHFQFRSKQCFSTTTRIHRNMKILAILYDGHQAAVEEPRLLGTTENQVWALSSALLRYSFFP
jgi:hypothetical protein